MIRPAQLTAIRAGDADLAFRRWDRPRVKVGTQLRTSVGLLEVTSVDVVSLTSLRAEDARRSASGTLAQLKQALSGRPGMPIHRIGLRHAGADPRDALRDRVPAEDEFAEILAGLERLDAASSVGAWTLDTLRLIDLSAEVRAPELAARVGRETADFKKDVRKLKERGLTESLAIGYRISPRGAALLDHVDGPRVREPRRQGTPLPRTIGAPATRALRALDVATLEQVAIWRRADLAALHGVGPVAVTRLTEALAEAGLSFAGE